MSEDRPGSGTPGTPGTPAGGLSEDQVARLLASAGGSEPTPPEVTARLDAVLADLVAERDAGGDAAAGGASARPRPDTDRTAAVVALSERRPRRAWGRRLLVAAAVLGVAGIGVSVLDDLGGGLSSNESATAGDSAGDSAADSAGGSAAQESGGDAGSGARTESGADGDTESGSEDSEDPLQDRPRSLEAAADAVRVPAVLRITGTADLRNAVRAAGRDAALFERGYGAEDQSAEADGRGALRTAPSACSLPRGPGARTLVTYEGSPATLVVRRVGDRLDGRVYDCDLGLQIDGVEIGPAEE